MVLSVLVIRPVLLVLPVVPVVLVLPIFLILNLLLVVPTLTFDPYKELRPLDKANMLLLDIHPIKRCSININKNLTMQSL